MLLQEVLDVSMPKSHDPTDQMTRQVPTFDHPVDRHLVQLKQLCELGNRVELPGIYMFDFVPLVLLPHSLAPRASQSLANRYDLRV
jgi:hypothetical protein